MIRTIIEIISKWPLLTKILVTASCVAAALGLVALTFHLHGQTRFTAGKLVCKADQATVTLIESTKATSSREKNENETRLMSDSDVDLDLRNSGWMRRAEDR